jgi:Na+/pantothenate symporter
VGTPVLLLPVVSAHTRWRPRTEYVPASMILSGLVSLFWLIMGRGETWLGIEAIFPGLLMSILILLPGIRRVEG